MNSCPLIPISIGELLDKISILSIKYQHTKNENVMKELNDLIKIAKKENVYIEKYVTELLQINRTLWAIEDRIRLLEDQNSFGDEFISLARSVYKNNDRRSEIKRKINEETESEYSEIKFYNK